MAVKKTQKSVDALREEVQRLAEAVHAVKDTMLVQKATAEAEAQSRTRSAAKSKQPASPVDVPGELDLDDTARLFAALGHPQRLHIVQMMLTSPVTASDVVRELELSTTGGAYHHLNVLQAAGLVVQAQRGSFLLDPTHADVISRVLNVCTTSAA